MKYVSLHHHSTYSFLDGYGHPKEHVARAAELGMTALALTEHGNVSSHPKLEMAAKEAGIKPIYGCEMYTGGSEPAQKKNHLSVWAEDQAGYQNLLRLVSWAWQEGFYYEPTVQGHALATYREGLIVASGCLGSLLATSLIGGKNIDPSDAGFERGLSVARSFKELLGDAYYLEVQAFPELEGTCQVNEMLEQIGKQLKIPLVATADVHYCHPEHSEMQVILHAVRPGTRRTFEEQERSWGYHIKLCHPESDEEVLNRLVHTGLSLKAAQQAVASTTEIAARCTVELPKAAPLKFPLDKRVDRRAYWIDLLRKGWEYRRIGKKSDSVRYAERLQHEVEVIEGKDFVDYFLIVGDMVRWAKNNDIFVGPGRGSAAGSLVCYLLRITEVDPMLFNDLVFERFIDVTRKDLPDIDLDFDDDRRFEVFAYLRDKYGAKHFNMLGTFTTYKSKSCLDDVARVFNVPKWQVDTVKELLISRSSGDLRASATIEDTCEMFPEAKRVMDEFPDLYKAIRLEGMVKGMGKHAAGAIVSSTPLTETCAVYGETIAVDKYDAEYLNLIKIDVLGLNTCGMLAEAAALLGQSIDYVYEIPLDDPMTIDAFRRNDVTGIFQFDGHAMRLVNNALKPDNFYEVCVVNALARPGPLHNNAMTDYVDIKHGTREPELRHPLFDAIVASTQYQVVYQEQILRIVREIGGFDWTAAAYIRRIISRKYGEQEFNRQGDKFMKGARANGLSKELASKIWGMCVTAGAYAFNAAHSVSYGMIGWWAMWLKMHHPQVFYTAALRRLSSVGAGSIAEAGGHTIARHLLLMRDAERHGLRVLPPHPKRSSTTWMPEGKRTLRAGLTVIPGVGEKTAEAIVDHREQYGVSNWQDLTAVKGIGPKTIENITAFVEQEDPLEIHKLDRMRAAVTGQIESGDLRGRNNRLLPMPTHRTEDVPYGRGKDTLVVWLGIVLNRNLRDLYEVNFARTGIPLNEDEVKDPHLREWVLLYGNDGEDTLTLRINRWRYPKFKRAIWSMDLGKDLVLVKGVKKGYSPQKIVDVTEMTVISP